MKLSPEFKPDYTVGDGESKYDPDYCYLDLTDPKRPVLVSTDGVMLTAVPVEAEADDATGPIPVRAVELARETRGIYPSATIETTDATVTIPDAAATSQRPGGTFPDWRKVIPEKGSVTVIVDVFRLMLIAQALGATEDHPRVTLNLEPNETGRFGIRVSRQSRDYEEALGCLQTARSEN